MVVKELAFICIAYTYLARVYWRKFDFDELAVDGDHCLFLLCDFTVIECIMWKGID